MSQTNRFNQNHRQRIGPIWNSARQRRIMFLCVVWFLLVSTNASDAQGQTDPALPAATAEVDINGPQGALLTVDGNPVGALPIAEPLRLRPGPHRLRIEYKQGRSTVVRQHPVSVVAGVPYLVRFLTDGQFDAVELTPHIILAVFNGQLRPAAPWACLTKVVADSVRSSGQAIVLSAERAAVATQREQPGCLEDFRCRLDLARRVGARYVVVVQSPTDQTAPARASVQIEDLMAASVSVAEDLTLSRCADDGTLAPLPEKLAAWLGQALSRPLGTLAVDSKPPGARIWVDKRDTGLTTPRRLTLFAGTPRISLRKVGFLPADDSTEVPPEGVGTMELTLATDPAAVTALRMSRGKWALLGVGVGSVAMGVATVALNGSTRDNPDIPGTPQYLLSWPYGVVALCMGGLALGGTLLFWQAERRAQRQSVVTEP